MKNFVFSEAVVMAGLRWTIVLIFMLFGLAKFAEYEAAGVAKIAAHYPLFAWMYPLWGESGASNVIGIFTFCVTLSFSLGAPAFWEAGYGAPYLGSTGQFLVKDAVLLAACFAIMVDGLRRHTAP